MSIKVKDLIEKLKEFDDNQDIVIFDKDCENYHHFEVEMDVDGDILFIFESDE